MSDKKSLGAEEIVTDRKLSRRSVAMLGAAVTGTLATLGLVSTTACCFGVPTGGSGGAVSGCSDSDPSDPAGNGRTCAGGGTRRSCSDSDPTDPAGAGSHC